MKNLNEISIEEVKGKRIYLAYGSNLNLKQMEERCPKAKVLGKGILNDYEIVFRGRRKSAVATIEPLKNGKVPILLWTIEKSDEKSLDIYEGYPSFYRKEDIEIQLKDGQIKSMAYIMNGQKIGEPNEYYFKAIGEGYKSAGFDINILIDAYLKSKELAEEQDLKDMEDRQVNFFKMKH